jgi:glycosyltransferase involved in cell wall biosynthesis
VTHVSFYSDPERRDPDTLLSVWPTLLGVAAGVARAGVEITVVQAAASRQTIERDGVTFHFVDDDRGMPARLPGGVRVPRRPSRLLDRVASLAPDVVHVHGLSFPLATRQLTRALPNTPVLVQDHASRPPHGWRRRAWHWAYADVAGVAFTARDSAQSFIEARALPNRVRVFEVVEGSSSFTPGDRDGARRATGIGGDPCFLWVGHLIERKDPLTTLDAFERASAAIPDARLWCCYGTAPLLDVVRRRIASSPVLRDRVVLLGARSHGEIEQLLRAADFFVQSSRFEGSGYALLEALSCGTPALVTDIPPVRRIVGDAGSLTPVGDSAALADAMVAWSTRDRPALRAAARARFESALSFDAIGRELRDVYESLVRSP